jgi:hypothetical protein
LIKHNSDNATSFPSHIIAKPTSNLNNTGIKAAAATAITTTTIKFLLIKPDGSLFSTHACHRARFSSV